jgi:hypothetical protein
MGKVDELAQCVPTPLLPVYALPPRDWKLLQAELNLAFPGDLLEYAGVYGSGVFLGEITTRLWLYNPFSPHYKERVVRECDRLKEGFNAGGIEAVPFPIYPTKGGLFPLGTDDCGTRIWWLTRKDQEFWPVVIQWALGADGFRVIRTTLLAFLVSLFRRKLLTDYWEEPWFIDNVRFIPEDSA